MFLHDNEHLKGSINNWDFYKLSYSFLVMEVNGMSCCEKDAHCEAKLQDASKRTNHDAIKGRFEGLRLTLYLRFWSQCFI